MSTMIVASPSFIDELFDRKFREFLGIQKPAQEPGEWLDTKGVAKALDVHPRTVGAYVRQGMPCTKLGPKTIRYQRAAVLAWIETGKR